MKNAKPFALTSVNKNVVKNSQKWKVKNSVATAGCSGPWARANSRWGADTCIFC